MSTIPACKSCNSEYVYEDRGMYICPECAVEWSVDEAANEASGEAPFKVFDSNGNQLADGDSVIVIKDLKVKGAAISVIKSGTKVNKIRLVDSDHNIDCRVEGVGQTGLKSEFVRKTS